jgi:hypothetical protein
MPVVVKWTLYDPIDEDGYTFEINPNEGGTPSRKKTLTYQATAAPDGKTLMFEGREEPQELQVSGVLLSAEQLAAFNAWMDKHHQVLLTDDLHRQFWIYMTALEPTRQRARSHPYKHQYSLTYTILDWPTA